MDIREVVQKSLIALVLVVAIALIIGQAVGQPFLLSYVTTDSMQPTLDPGDGFIAVPQPIAGPVEAGDVIVYQAEQLHDGGLTTHRVVGETDRGYLTKGDANPFTDQDRRDEPPVKEAQIVAQALQIGGHIVVIPHLGDAVTFISTSIQRVQRILAGLFGINALLGPTGLAYLIFATSLIYYVVSWRRSRKGQHQNHRLRHDHDTGLDARLIIGVFTLVLVVGATLPMVVPAGTQKYGVVSAEFESEHPTVIPAGESKSLPQPLVNEGRLPVIVYLQPASDGVDVQPRQTRLEGGERMNATVTLHAPDQIGYYPRFVVQHRYLALLPPPVIRSLYSVHPWTPIVVIDALIGIPFYLLSIRLLGTGRIRNRSRPRDLSVLTRLHRAFRSLYR